MLPTERGLAFCLLLIGASSCVRPTPSEADGARPAASSSAASGSRAALVPASATDPRTRGWALGQEYPYELSLSTQVFFGPQSKILDFDLSADVVVIPTAVTSRETTLFVALRKVKLASHVPESQAELEKVAAQAGNTGCLVTLSGGLVTEIRIASDLSPLTVGIYREVGSRLQFAHSLNDAAKYEVEEHDGTGRYLAEYARDPGSPGRYQKRKLRYSSILAPKTQLTLSPLNVVPEVPASAGAIMLSPDGRPLSVQAHDEVAINGAQNPVQSKTKLSLKAGKPVSGAAHDWNAVASRLTRFAVDEPYGIRAPLQALDSARIRGLTYDQITKRLDELSAAIRKKTAAAPSKPGVGQQSERDVQESAMLFTALAATFREQPAMVSRAVQSVRAGAPIAQTLVDALGSSGNERAHQGLAQLISSKDLDPKLRSRALTALARTSEPSPVAINALKSLLTQEPFNEDALYGLGTYARRFRDDGKTEQAQSIAKLLSERLPLAKELTPHLLVALRALMNCGCDQARPRVMPYLSDYRDSVRAAAVRALQSMRDREVDGLIASRLEADSATEVRVAAMDAARVREPSEVLVKALSSATTAADPHVRYRAVDLIIQWLPKRKDLTKTLAQIGAQDPEPRVRSRAKAAL